MFHCSAAEGQKFQTEAIRVTEIIEKLGSNPLKQTEKTDSKKEKKKK